MLINPDTWFPGQVDPNTIQCNGDAFSKANHVLVNLQFVVPELSAPDTLGITNALLATDRISNPDESHNERYLRLLEGIKSAFLQTGFGKLCQTTEWTIADGFVVDQSFVKELNNRINVGDDKLAELGQPMDEQTRKMLLNDALFWYFGGSFDKDLSEDQRQQVAFTVIRREIRALILNQNMPSFGVKTKYSYKQFDTYFIGDDLIDCEDPILLCVVASVCTLIDKRKKSGKFVNLDELKLLVDTIYSTVKSDIAKGIPTRKALGRACYANISLVFSEKDSMLAVQKLVSDQ